MRRIISLLLVALLALTAWGSAVAEGIGMADGAGLGDGAAVVEGSTVAEGAVIGDDINDNLQVVSVPEQGFSTKIPAYCEWSFHPDGGLAIELGTASDAPWINLFRAEDAPGSEFDYQYFFDNTFTPQMQNDLGGALLQVGKCVANNIAGVEMMGVQYTYLSEGKLRKCLCMFDLREDGFVQYEARYNEEDQDRCLLALALAAVNYQPDPDYYSGPAPAPQPTEAPAPAPQPEGGLGVIQCPEMGFETMYDTAGSWKYTDGQGVYIYAPGMDDYSFACVYRDAGLLEDPGAYLRDQDMPFWKSQFGQDFISYTEYERYALAGRELPAMVYTYRNADGEYEILRVVDERDGHSVLFSAQYPRGAGEIALKALNTAAEHFKTLSGDTAPAPQPTEAPAPQPTQAPLPPVSSGDTMPIECPDQGFTTVCDAAYTWQYMDGDGVYIFVEQPNNIPFAYVARADQSVGDGASYIRDVEVPVWQERYGQNLVNYTVYDNFSVGGKILPAALYTHRSSGFLLDMLRVVDSRPDGTAFFVAHYIQGEGEAALKALELAVANYSDGGGSAAPQPTQEPAPQPTQAPAPRDTAGLSVAACPQMGFSTLCDPSVLQKYDESTGLNLFIEGEERIPYVLVYQTGDKIGEPGEYLREQYTPYMRQKYGSDLVSVEEYDAYSIGSKSLPAALYTYMVQGKRVDMLRIMDSTGAQTVTYTAKYIDGEGDATLAALDNAIKYYQPDPNYYGAK